MGAPLGDPEPSRSLFTCGGLGRILNGEAVLGWVQEPAEEIGETLKDRVVGAWTWGLGGILGESGGGVLRKTEQAWPRHVCASQSSEPVWRGGGLRILWSTFSAHPGLTAIGPCNTACRGRQSLKHLVFLPASTVTHSQKY